MTSKHSLWTRWVQQNKRYTWLYVINSIVLLFSDQFDLFMIYQNREEISMIYVTRLDMYKDLI